jgi:hypothetical protein
MRCPYAGESSLGVLASSPYFPFEGPPTAIRKALGIADDGTTLPASATVTSPAAGGGAASSAGITSNASGVSVIGSSLSVTLGRASASVAAAMASSQASVAAREPAYSFAFGLSAAQSRQLVASAGGGGYGGTGGTARGGGASGAVIHDWADESAPKALPNVFAQYPLSPLTLEIGAIAVSIADGRNAAAASAATVPIPFLTKSAASGAAAALAQLGVATGGSATTPGANASIPAAGLTHQQSAPVHQRKPSARVSPGGAGINKVGSKRLEDISATTGEGSAVTVSPAALARKRQPNPTAPAEVIGAAAEASTPITPQVCIARGYSILSD